VATDATFNTGGLTTFGGTVGQSVPLASIATDNAGEGTTVRGSVTTAGDQTYGDAVTFDPAAGVVAQAVTASTGSIAFQKTLGGSTVLPVTVKAGSNVAFNGDATFSASGSRLNVQAGASGVGAFAFASGITIKADM